jgi:hypothetical protein
MQFLLLRLKKGMNKTYFLIFLLLCQVQSPGCCETNITLKGIEKADGQKNSGLE